VHRFYAFVKNLLKVFPPYLLFDPLLNRSLGRRCAILLTWIRRISLRTWRRLLSKLTISSSFPILYYVIVFEKSSVCQHFSREKIIPLAKKGYWLAKAAPFLKAKLAWKKIMETAQKISKNPNNQNSQSVTLFF